MVAAEVSGIQSQNISGCVKHFIENTIEADRSGMSSNVPRRVHMEMYMKAFCAAVDAGVGSAMAAYNRLNGTWSSENAQAISDLKDKCGFRGWLMSDVSGGGGGGHTAP